VGAPRPTAHRSPAEANTGVPAGQEVAGATLGSTGGSGGNRTRVRVQQKKRWRATSVDSRGQFVAKPRFRVPWSPPQSWRHFGEGFDEGLLVSLSALRDYLEVARSRPTLPSPVAEPGPSPSPRASTDPSPRLRHESRLGHRGGQPHPGLAVLRRQVGAPAVHGRRVGGLVAVAHAKKLQPFRAAGSSWVAGAQQGLHTLRRDRTRIAAWVREAVWSRN